MSDPGRPLDPFHHPDESSARSRLAGCRRRRRVDRRLVDHLFTDAVEVSGFRAVIVYK